MSPVTRALGLEGQGAGLDRAVDQPGEPRLAALMLPRTSPLCPWVRAPQRTSPVTLPSRWSSLSVAMSPVTVTSLPRRRKSHLALAADGRLAAARKHALSSPLGGAASSHITGPDQVGRAQAGAAERRTALQTNGG